MSIWLNIKFKSSSCGLVHTANLCPPLDAPEVIVCYGYYTSYSMTEKQVELLP